MTALLLACWQHTYATILKWCGIAAGVFFVWFNIKQSGRNDQRADDFINQNKQVEKANEVEIDVRRLDDGTALTELRNNWLRK